MNTVSCIKNSTFYDNWFFSVISGVLIILSQPPLSLYPVAYIALIPLISSLKKNNMRHSFISGFITGIVSYLGLIYWVVIAMNRYGGIDIYTSSLILLLFVLYLACYTGVFALSVSFLETKLFVPLYISAPVLWVLLEYLRGILMTGFPWYLFAYSQHNFLPAIQIVSITGPYFVSFLIVSMNCILYHIFIIMTGKIKSKREPVFLLYVAVVTTLITATLFYGYNRMNFKDKGDLKVAIIQGNTLQNLKWDDAYKANIVKTYYQKTLEAGKGANLVIWPETAMPFVFNEDIHVNRFVKELSCGLKTSLLFGTVSRDKEGKYYNTSYVYDNTGELAGSYSKVHLVPFGEYTPLIEYLPFLTKFTAAGGDFKRGENHRPVKTSAGSIGILICYEGTFPYITNDTVRKGGQVLVNITNDAWFGKTSAPYQHLTFYVFRAIETDRYVLRAANTGISAIIDPRGRIVQNTGIFTEDSLKGNFSLHNGETFYVNRGDYFIFAAFLFLAFVCGIKVFKISIKNRKAEN